MNRLWMLFLLILANFSNLNAEKRIDQSVSLSYPSPNQIHLSAKHLFQEHYECIQRSYKKECELPNFANLDQFETMLSAECEPLATVAGCVNVISGKFFQIEKDLISTTIDPLDFVRYYDSGCTSESFLGYGFGSGFPLWASNIEKGARHHYGLISERENFLLLYRDKEHGYSKMCSVDPRILEKGYTNLCRSHISGKTNFTNWKAILDQKIAIPLNGF